MAVGIAAWPRERLLMVHAKRVTSVNNGGDSNYFWLSEQEALIQRYRTDGDWFEFTCLNTQTHTETPLTAFNQKYRSALASYTFRGLGFLPNGSRGSQTFHIPPACDLSPDHSLLLLRPMQNYSIPKIIYIAATLNGIQKARWAPGDDSYSPLWLHDSRHWLEAVYKSSGAGNLTNLTLHDCSNPKVRTRLPVPVEADTLTPVGINQKEQMVYIQWDYQKSYDFLDCYEQNLTSPIPSGQKRRIRLPYHAALRDVEISPRGDRLAWWLQYEHVLPGASMLHRVYPAYPVKPQSMLSLWTSRADGTEMNEVGHIPILPGSDSDPGSLSHYYPINIQWTPDEKHLSFVYKDALYTVPTE